MFRILLSFLFLFLLQTGFAFSQCNVTLGTDTGVVGELRDCLEVQTDVVVNVQVDVLLTEGEIVIDRDVEIVGTGDPGTGPTINQTDAPSRLFAINDDVTPLNVIFRNLTLTGSSVTDFGGLIFNNDNNVTVDCSNLIDMTVDSPGGAIHSTGSNGSLIITESTISGNTAVNNGGGIFVDDHTATITDSTIDDNTSTTGAGGGIAIGSNGILDMTNSTVSNNDADTTGGGILNSGATSNIDNSTITDNSATGGGGGIDNAGTLIVTNSIVANQILGGDCLNTDTLTSNGGNIESAMSCGFMSVGDLQDTDPLIGALANNGGKTDTHILLPGSPAIDNAGTCGLADDQRGEPREADACDTGSVEVQKATLTITKDTDPAGLLSFSFSSDIPDENCTPMPAGGEFTLDDDESISCTITEGDYNVAESIPADNSLTISCATEPADGVSINDTLGTLDFTTLPEDTAVDCTFTNIDDSVFTLDVVLGGPGTGTVTGPVGVPANGGINCPGDCTESYNPGTNVTLVATANNGSEFQGWSDDCNASGQVTINGNRTCVATFKLVGGGDVLNPGDPLEFIQDNVPEVNEGGEGTFIVTARNATNANLTNVEISIEDELIVSKQIQSVRLEPSTAFLEPNIGSCIILEDSVECDIATLTNDVDIVIDFVAEDVPPGDVDIFLTADADQIGGLVTAIALVIITSGDGSGCTVASPGSTGGASMLLFLLIPVVVVTRRYLKIRK